MFWNPRDAQCVEALDEGAESVAANTTLYDVANLADDNATLLLQLQIKCVNTCQHVGSPAEFPCKAAPPRDLGDGRWRHCCHSH